MTIENFTTRGREFAQTPGEAAERWRKESCDISPEENSLENP
jgi:hypothetical protein